MKIADCKFQVDGLCVDVIGIGSNSNTIVTKKNKKKVEYYYNQKNTKTQIVFNNIAIPYIFNLDITENCIKSIRKAIQNPNLFHRTWMEPETQHFETSSGNFFEISQLCITKITKAILLCFFVLAYILAIKKYL